MNLSASSRNNLIKRTKTIKNACYILVVNTKKKKRKWINLSTRGRQKVWASLLPVMPHIGSSLIGGFSTSAELGAQAHASWRWARRGRKPLGVAFISGLFSAGSRVGPCGPPTGIPPTRTTQPPDGLDVPHKLQRDRAGYTAGAGRLSSLLYHCQKALLSFGFFYFFLIIIIFIPKPSIFVIKYIFIKR